MSFGRSKTLSVPDYLDSICLGESVLRIQVSPCAFDCARTFFTPQISNCVLLVCIAFQILLPGFCLILLSWQGMQDQGYQSLPRGESRRETISEYFGKVYYTSNLVETLVLLNIN